MIHQPMNNLICKKMRLKMLVIHKFSNIGGNKVVTYFKLVTLKSKLESIILLNIIINRGNDRDKSVIIRKIS